MFVSNRFQLLYNRRERRATGPGGGGPGNHHQRQHRRRRSKLWITMFLVSILLSTFGLLVITFINNSNILEDIKISSSSAVLPTTEIITEDLSSSSSSSSQLKDVAKVGEDTTRSNPSSSVKASTTTTKSTETPTITIAYAISLIKCGDNKVSNSNSMIDSATVLRHSIHQTSIRNPTSNSKYDYKMYAIIHKQAVSCSQQLATVGFELLIVDPPILQQDIQGEYLKSHIHREVCCGSDEFVKLYAYNPQIFPPHVHPLVVHLDLDFIVTKPMDDLFDVMLHPVDSIQYQQAKSKIYIEKRPTKSDDVLWPNHQVDALFTRDWPQVLPGRKSMYQAGFQIVRPNQTVFDKMIHVIKVGHYVEGFGRDNGWGGLGYGGNIGSMAMQGLLAYVYDEIYPNTYMELNQCKYNHMGMDVKKRGKCRNNLPTCEDCMETPLEEIYSIHYTACRKPWLCPSVGDKEDKNNRGKTIPEDVVHVSHCLKLQSVWHTFRSDLEDKLFNLTNDNTIREQGQSGTHMKEYFQGHCKGHGYMNYLGISGKPETLQRIPELYNS